MWSRRARGEGSGGEVKNALISRKGLSCSSKAISTKVKLSYPNFICITCAPVAVTSPGRHRRVTAETEEVVTGSPLSGITRGIMLHDTVAMASTAGGVVGL